MASRLIRFPWPMNVGTDICQVSRIQTILSCPTGRGRHFVRRILCEEELRRPSSKLKSYLRVVLKFAKEHDTLKQQGKETEGFGHGHKRLEQKWKGQGVDLGEVAAFMAGRFAAKEAAIKAHPHRHLTFHDIIVAKAAELDQIERELAASSSSSSKTFTGSTTGPTTKVDPKNIMPEDRLFDQQLDTTINKHHHHVFEGSARGPTTPVDTQDIMPEDRVFDYKLETDKPNGHDRAHHRSFTGSKTGPTTPVDTKDIMPEDMVFDYHLETDKRPFEGSTTGPTTPVDTKDIMPEDRVFDYHLETDKPDTTTDANDTTLEGGKTTTTTTKTPQEAPPGRARLGSGPPVAIIRGVKGDTSTKKEGGEGGDADHHHHQVALLSISHDGDYATATCVGFDAGSMVKGGLGWMVSR